MQQHHHQATERLARGKMGADVVIQLAGTSASQHNISESGSRGHLRAPPSASSQHEPTRADISAAATTSDTEGLGPNRTTSSSSCSKRDLIQTELQQQQQHQHQLQLNNHKHRHWRRNFGDSRAPASLRQVATTSLQVAEAGQQANSTNSATSADSDNISDDSIPPPPNYHEIPGIVPSYHGRTSGPPPAYDDVMNPNGSPPSYQSLFGQVREARKSSNGLVDLLRQLLLVLIGTIGCTMIIGFLLLIPITMIFIGFLYINECRAENIPTFLVVGGFVWIIKNMLNCYNQFKRDSSSVNRPPPRRAPPARLQPQQQQQTTTTTTTTTMATTTTIDVAVSQAPATTSFQSSLRESSGSGLSDHLRASLQIDIEQQQQPATITATTSHLQPAQSQRQQTRQTPIRQPQMIGLTSDKCESILNYFLIVWFLAGCIVVYRIYEPDYENPLSANYCHRTIYLYAFWLMTSAFIIIAIVLSCLCCLMASSLMSCSHGR